MNQKLVVNNEFPYLFYSVFGLSQRSFDTSKSLVSNFDKTEFNELLERKHENFIIPNCSIGCFIPLNYGIFFFNTGLHLGIGIPITDHNASVSIKANMRINGGISAGVFNYFISGIMDADMINYYNKGLFFYSMKAQICIEYFFSVD